MPLYAFDGTWNVDKPGTEHDTNVTWFHGAYSGPKRYFKGIGTRGGCSKCGSAAFIPMSAAATSVQGCRASPVAQNAARLSPNDRISVHGLGKVEGRDRVVRWNDFAHKSVAFRPSAADSHHNNPSDNVALIDDDGREVGKFKRA